MGLESVVFGRDNSTRARFQLGGTITELSCDPGVIRTRCQMAVKWELFDTVREVVVYTVLTRATLEEDRSVSLAPRHGYVLVRGALESLLKRPAFPSQLRRASGFTVQAPGYEALKVKACTAAGLALPRDMSRILAGTVLIKRDNGFGSGVLISPDGFVLTAAHVVRGSTAVTAAFQNGIELSATPIRIDEGQDVALLKLPGSGHACIGAGSSTPDVGQTLFAVGAPAGEALAFSVSRGVVSGLRTWEGARFIQTDASLNPGNSGGPLLNDAGELVGIVSWKVQAPGFEGLSFGIPMGAVTTRLGIEWSDRSDVPSTGGPIAAVAESPTGPIVDTPDPAEVPPTNGPSSNAGLARVLRRVGLAALIVGLVSAAGTGLAYDPEMTSTDFATLRAANTACWTLAIGGAGTVGVGAVMELQPGGSRHETSLRFGGTGISIQGRF